MVFKYTYIMYVYLEPSGGFNDILAIINRTIIFCKKTNRTLLLNTRKTSYKINFKDYFYFKELNIIVDTDIIKNIILDTGLSIYPNIFKDRNIDNWKFYYSKDKKVILELNTKTYMLLDDNNINYIDYEIIIIVDYSRSNKYSLNTILLFNILYFNKNIIDHVNTQYANLPKPYLCIQIRNTDYKCDYISLYESNKDKIHSYDTIYIATDDKESIEWFKSKGLTIYNFTEYPSVSSRNLHYSDISSDRKIKDLICDIYIITMANELLSNSVGGFINLCKDIRKNPKLLADKFLIN